MINFLRKFFYKKAIQDTVVLKGHYWKLTGPEFYGDATKFGNKFWLNTDIKDRVMIVSLLQGALLGHKKATAPNGQRRNADEYTVFVYHSKAKAGTRFSNKLIVLDKDLNE